MSRKSHVSKGRSTGLNNNKRFQRIVIVAVLLAMVAATLMTTASILAN